MNLKKKFEFETEIDLNEKNIKMPIIKIVIAKFKIFKSFKKFENLILI